MCRGILIFIIIFHQKFHYNAEINIQKGILKITIFKGGNFLVFAHKNNKSQIYIDTNNKLCLREFSNCFFNTFLKIPSKRSSYFMHWNR